MFSFKLNFIFRHGKKLDTFSGDKSETGLKEYIARSVMATSIMFSMPILAIFKDFIIMKSSRVPFKRFGDLVAWMKEHGLEEDLEDEKYATLKGVTEHADHIDGVIARFVAHLPADEIAHGGQQRQFNWGSIRAPEDLLE